MALTAWRSRSVQIGLSSSSWKKVRQRILMLAVSNEWFRRPLNRIPPMIALQTAAPDDRDEIDHGAEHFGFSRKLYTLVLVPGQFDFARSPNGPCHPKATR